MSYLVFARKYRPQTFSEILGQEPIVTTLTNAIRQKRIGQAYLFSGPRGTGKTSTARIFAKGLNCLKGPTEKPCGTCQQCEEITQGRSLDVLEIDGASNRGIDQIRALRELARFAPAAAAYKVYIIDEVHQITAEGFNALLKTLEEPPPHVLFILATTASHKVPATILSRCQRYDFKRLPLEVISAKIKAVAREERLTMEEEAVIGIARAASGSLRDAESLLDQVAAFTGGRIKAMDLQNLLGTIPADLFSQALEGIRSRDSVALLRLVAQSANAGTDLIQWAFGFLSFMRNVLVAKVGAGPLGFEDLGEEELQRMHALAKGFSIEELTRILQALSSAVETMRRMGEPRIPLETALVRLSTGGPMVAVAELVERLEKLDERLRKGEPAQAGTAPAAAQLAAPAPAAEDPPTSNGQALTLEKIVSVWPALIDQIHQQKASTAAFLGEAVPVTLNAEDPPELVAGFPRGFEFHRDSLSHLQTRQLVEKALAGLLGSAVRLSFKIVESVQKTAESPQKESPLKADPSWLGSVAELFEGRVLPGEG